TDGALSNTAPVTVGGVGLYVTAFTPTPSGFTASFSEALLNTSSSPIHLYDAASAGYGPPDVTLLAHSPPTLHASLILNGSGTGFTFVKTGGVLATDTYTVTFASGATALQDTGGNPLNGNGINAGNYLTTFTVSVSPAIVVSLPDFARGPDNNDVIN